MIVWLASYPRSGNTFLRMILNKACEASSFSIYDERPLKIGRDRLEQLPEGEAGDPYDLERIYQTARDSKKLHLMKTHDAPRDDAPAVFIERDGRAACVSYYHYLKEFEKPDVTMADVVLGRTGHKSWSEYFESWLPLSRPNTLLIQFEDLVRNVDEVTLRVASFLGLPLRRNFDRDFAYLHEIAPKFFRKGDNEANIAELNNEDLALFWMMHGSLMKERGYVNSIPETPIPVRDTLIQQRERWGIFVEERFRRILGEIEEDRAELVLRNEMLEGELRTIDADRKTKEGVLERVLDEMRAIDSDRRVKDERIAALVDELVATDGDRRAKGTVIARLTEELDTLRADHRDRGDVIGRLLAELDQFKSRA